MTFYTIRWNKLSAGLRPTLIPDRDGSEYNAEQRYVEMKLPTAGDAFGDVAGLIEAALREDNELVSQRNAMVKPMAEEVKEMYRKEGRLRFRVPRDIIEVAREAAETLTSEVSDKKAATKGKTRFRLGDSKSFKQRQAESETNRGTVSPGLNSAMLKVTEIPMHGYSGRYLEAEAAAVKDAINKYTHLEIDERGRHKIVANELHYDNFGKVFDYVISINSIKESINKAQKNKSKEQGAAYGIHLAVLNHIDEVIKNSIEFEEHPDCVKKEGERSISNINPHKLVHRFVGVIEIAQKRYRVISSIHEYSQIDKANREYAYDVAKIEVLDAETTSTSNGVIGAGFGLEPVTKLLNNFEKYYDPGKKILDESAKRDEEIAHWNGRSQFRVAMEAAVNEPTKFRIRTEPAPVKTGVGYKVFVVKNGRLYPPMVANADREATPVGVWLDADANEQFIVGGKEGVDAEFAHVEPWLRRYKVKSGGKGTQGSSGELAYRPGWHLGEIPYALQFNRKNEETGEKELFPAKFVWCEVEYAADVDYQQESDDRMWYNKHGNKLKNPMHSMGGLNHVPENGAYIYRTNPNPATDPWIITGSMKVTRILKPSEVDAMVTAAGRIPQVREAGALTDADVEVISRELGLDPDDPNGPESGGRSKKKKGTKKKRSVPAVPRDIFEVARESAQRIANRGAGGTSFRSEAGVRQTDDGRIDESPGARQTDDGRQTASTESEPTEAQKEAGNYRKKHVWVDEHAISIENEAGRSPADNEVRRGRDADGKEWATEMKFDYGYIRGTEGVDGDHIDVFLSGTPERGDVYVVDQVNKDGSFDEHKVMYGFDSEEEARAAYLSNYEEGWQGLGAITRVSREEFKKWVRSSKRKTKPFAEYKGVKTGGTQFRENDGDEDILSSDMYMSGRETGKYYGPVREKNSAKEVNGYIDRAISFVTGREISDVARGRRIRENERKLQTKKLHERILKLDFDAVTLQQIEKYINESTPENPYGRRISQRLPQRVERSLFAHKREDGVDALFSRASEGAVPPIDRKSAEGKRRIEEKKKDIVRAYAKASGIWYERVEDVPGINATEILDEGKDAKVYISSDGSSVIKIKHGKPYGKRFRPDLDDISLFNYIFRPTRYEILGYGDFGYGVSTVVRQPFVHMSEAPVSRKEKVEFMKKLKFEPINKELTAFSNGTIIAADIQGKNIVKDIDGNIRVIDADMKLHMKSEGGHHVYPEVEEDWKIMDAESEHTYGRTKLRVTEDPVAREAVGTHRGARTQFRITGVPAVAAAAVYESRVRTGSVSFSVSEAS